MGYRGLDCSRRRMWKVGYACKDDSNRESDDDCSYDDCSSSKEPSCHGFDLLPGQVSRFPRLINDVRKTDSGSPSVSGLGLHGVSSQESACDNRNRVWSPGRGLNPGPTAFSLGYKAVAPPLSYRGSRLVGGVEAKISSTEYAFS